MKEALLPEAHNDMVFTVVGEQAGIVAGGLLLLLCGLVAIRRYRQRRKPSDGRQKAFDESDAD